MSIVDHPRHYSAGKYEVIDVIDDWNLDFYEGNVIKYIARSKREGKRVQDLEEALWYLNRYVEILRAKEPF